MTMTTTTTSSSSIREVLICVIGILGILTSTSAAQSSFKCSRVRSCDDAIIDYVSPNSTTLTHIKNLFNIKNLRAILGANNFPLATPPNQTLPPNHPIKIPIPCICVNGTGKSNHRPIYKVAHGDTLYHIAAEVFSGLVTYQQIQAANNVPDPNLIKVGQKLWIPLPCSCDDVDGQRVVHYGHLVASGTTLDSVAHQFNTSLDLLLKLNGLAAPKLLKPGALLDVPLKACTSTLSNNSLDYPLLVPNGSYVFTAANCVVCNCDAANNWTLQCEPTQIKSSLWASCPSMQCREAENLYVGNSTSSGCDRTTCSYAGYTNQTILTALSLDSTCPASSYSSYAVSLHGRTWNLVVVALQLMLFYFRSW